MRQGRFARFTASFTLMMFTFVFYLSPTGSAVAQEVEQEAPIQLTGTTEQKMNQGLVKVQEFAAEKATRTTQRLAEESGLLDSILELFGLSRLTLEDVGDLRTLSTLLAEQHTQALADFDQVEAELTARNLPEEILQRQHDTVAAYLASYQEMQQKLEALVLAKSLEAQQAAAAALDDMMKGQKLKRSHQKTDPNNLPFGTPDASKTRKPADSPRELSSLTGISPLPQGTLVAANVITAEMLGQPGGPVAEDLTETPDVQFTEAIKAKALELDEDPVKIYNWVRNNIKFIPSYGSIQGADYTLQHGKGNAFDTASLLVALLRTANVPARYAYGTVEIPAEKVMNWVGGADVPEAAQQLLGQGGIPNVALISGGEITHIRMEQVWVEAWVDYFPSRAAKHTVGDSWIHLDASFKQYEFTEGQNVASNVPFDVQGLVDELSATASIDETNGWVSDVNQTAMNQALADYRQQVEEYIKNQNPDSTVGDVLGTQKVIVKEFQQLAAGLPYTLSVRTNNYSALPANLRHKFRYTLGTEYFGTESSRLITFERPLATLAGKQLALSFKPTSSADEDLITSYLPESSDDPIDVSIDQLPDTLPGYLINLTAEFTQDDEVVHSATAGTMGGELYETLALWSPSQGWQQAVNHPVAGEYRAIGLNLQGASLDEAARLQARGGNTKAILDSADDAQLATLTKRDVVGDMLYAVIYSYLALIDLEDDIQARSTSILNYRLPSYGLFTTNLRTSYFYGVPRNVTAAGMVIDVDHLSTQTTAKNNDHDATVNFIRSSGMRASAMEHLIPEKILSTEDSPAQGISAVRAIALAGAAGQKIWTINQSNLNIALAAINLDSDIETDIRNAVHAGKIATAHEQPVFFAGSFSTGYLLIDPITGAGAYKIAGGANGGLISTLYSVLIYLASAVGGFADGFRGTGATSNLVKLFGRLGYWALGIGVILTGLSIFTDDSLAFSDQLGQFSVNLAGAAAAGIAAGFIAGIALPAVATAFMALAAALVIAFVFNELALFFFSWYRARSKYDEAYV